MLEGLPKISKNGLSIGVKNGDVAVKSGNDIHFLVIMNVRLFYKAGPKT